MNEPIPLSQKLYLLAIHPEKGGVIAASYTAINYVLVGSLFLELYQNKNIKFDNKRVIVLSLKSDNDFYRFLLEKIGKSKRSLRISTWIQKFQYSIKRISTEVQQDLVEKRIIRMEPKQFLFFKWKKPVLVNKQVVSKLVIEIEKQVFGGSVSEDEIMLLSFLKPAGLLNRIFPEREKRKKANAHLKKMMVENQMSHAVADAISAAQAVAASVAITAAATSSAH
ncbi:MAG: GPP34 family phosphoprotein [Bacteroidetes bacterium]|nr:GPP34 family phosphoprotein [Bacteroidota bacterium]